ncbi:zinc finger BED domain-containing protein 5-like [Centruroides sculpturatus]|uniref:zinc finger BED domain-containing protein 5-like n=1 Tax=Centruroides sculpturatus TaxID=218467 RepID=UPI000C6D2C7B|nr:zinc finger BED domain-containing protein 5-like [Centruroides sculpturatus]
MSGSSKRQQTYNFNTEWEDLYCFVNLKDKCICLLCGNSVAVPKKHNVECHFLTIHATFNINYPLKSEIRKKKIDQLKSNLFAQQSVFTRPALRSKNATIASLKISHILAKKKKPFQDGELLKEAFLTGADCLFEGFSNKCEIMSAIQDLQLSDNTITRRIQAISKDMQTQLKSDLEISEWFSLQFDESTDISYIAQLAVMVRMVFSDFTVKDLLKILPMKGRTTGEDIYKIFITYAKLIDIPLQKLSAITTDGAPAMVGNVNGFIALCIKDKSFPNFMSYHCIIHQEVLCGKILPFGHVMKIITKIVNLIRAAPLQHRLFKALLENPEDPDLILHTEVRWLSKGKVLARFVNLIEEIKNYLNAKHQNFFELTDPRWLADLAFFTDIMEKLNYLNLELQGKDKHIATMIGSINSFKAKLNILEEKNETGAGLEPATFAYWAVCLPVT